MLIGGNLIMFERLKDFFYDVSDIILSIIIVVIMVFAISWKLSDTISYSPIKVNLQESSSYAVNPEPDESHSLESENPSNFSEEEENNSEETSTETESPESENNEASEGETAEEVPSTETESPSEGDVVAKPSNENINVVSVKEINFIVPSGATGSSIAKKLQSEGLIEDTSIFLNRLEALNLGNKLRSGTFKLSTDMDIDSIINKLTGR